MEHRKNNSIREVYRHKSLPQETKKNLKQSNFTPKATGGRRKKQKTKLVEVKKS